MSDIKYPLSDSDMIYDYSKHRYILTPDFVTRSGINLINDVNSWNAPNGGTMVNRVLDIASMQVYNYIFAHANNSQAIEYIIAKSPKARDVIKRAMLEQLTLITTEGDLSRSIRKEERDLAIDYNAKRICEETIPEVGRPLISAIPWGFPPSYDKGEY